ncbi:hypothetical protein [Catellatospora chokoriensis]|uniref:Uncharacterized protein n=1 Tax=Catellatospora chokoriensis TaxID=310353 RepID=A0A8J3NWE7_9ACTN|nr:hypothetical protein [Catellatospora chokoriensis]GIF94828.1 hypothetical protein Cch02nite_82720 [Catellatospora chokoriensis]
MGVGAALRQAAWTAYVDLVYGLLRTIQEGEWYEGELGWEWSVLIEHLHDDALGDRRAGMLALLDQALAVRRDTPVDRHVLIGYLYEIADELRQLAAQRAVDGF